MGREGQKNTHNTAALLDACRLSRVQACRPSIVPVAPASRPLSAQVPPLHDQLTPILERLSFSPHDCAHLLVPRSPSSFVALQPQTSFRPNNQSFPEKLTTSELP